MKLHTSVKRIINILRKRDLILHNQLNMKYDIIGNKDASFAIAAGSLDSKSVVYSFGVGTDISFDEGLIDAYGSTVYAFDPTPRSIAWIERNSSLPDRFIFRAWGISNEDKLERFYPPVLDAHVSYSIDNIQNAGNEFVEGQVYRLATIMKKLGHARLDLLKMDVEGAEYAALDDILRSGIDVSQILVEFHHRFYRGGAARTRNIIRTLNQKNYRIFYISESGEEYSFLVQKSLQ